ncbi:MAG: DUF4115 domain-containing protein, partial [Desulfobulbaceae bacterium]|nr:DUF4115 domain-containing protein [Desulfobulbaceae bacterium]
LKDTWVDITSDNGPQVRHIADQGDTRIIEAKEWIKLKFGKPESARIRLNGIDIDCPTTPDETGHVSLSIPEGILD